MNDKKRVNKNVQQPKVWPTSRSAHRSVLSRSPLYPGGLQTTSGRFRRQFTHMDILHPKTTQGAGLARQKAYLYIMAQGNISQPLA
jgi:hypothetical protein